MTILYGDSWDLINGIEDNSLDCVITSPPYYGLKLYSDNSCEFGVNETVSGYIEKLVILFSKIRQKLKDSGTVWLNIGDSYSVAYRGEGASNKSTLSSSSDNNKIRQRSDIKPRKYEITVKPKNILGIPWKVAFALQDDNWYLRQDIIWNKPNAKPESVKDRCVKSHEYLFLLTKSPKYYFNHLIIQEDAITQNKRNKRSVWNINTEIYKGNHHAAFPTELVRTCILAGCPENGIVFDPFLGSGTTAKVAKDLNRNFIGFELNKDFEGLINDRLQ